MHQEENDSLLERRGGNSNSIIIISVLNFEIILLLDLDSIITFPDVD